MKALIVYASLTGNTEEISEILAKKLTALGVDVKVRECTQVDPEAFLLFDICIVGTYTWGREGELPDEIVNFYEGLKNIDLTGKIYGTFGSGEEAYGYYCKSADDFDKQFQLTHATKGAEVLKIEAFPEEEDIPNIEKFAKELVEAAKATID